MDKMKLKITLFLLLAALVQPIFSQEEVELENQLRRAKKDLEQLEKERKKIQEATQEDYKQFKEYQQRARKKFKALKQKNDSLNQIASGLRSKNGQLGSRINSIKSSQREYDIYQQRVKQKLEKLCDTLLQVTEALSPLLSEKNSASIKFLKSEIQASTSDNIESMNRLFSILTELDNKLMSIEVEQGTSPLPNITGVVYRLRIGGIFESLVNEKGTQAALWDFKEQKWEMVDDKDTVTRIRKAVSIRIGKSVPELVPLPLTLKDEK